MQDTQERPNARRRPRRLTYVSVLGTAVGMTALATAGLAGSAGAARTVFVDVPVPTATASPTPAATAAAKAPQMRLAMSYQRSGKVVTLTISLDGYVLEPLDANNAPVAFPTPATAAIGLGEELSWGDGTVSNTPAKPWHCGKPQNLHQVKDSYTVSRTYAAAGSYSITYSFKACGLTDGKITGTIPLTF